MKTRKLFLVFWFLASSFSTAYGGDLLSGGPWLVPNDPSYSHRDITAIVSRVVSDMVFFKTEEKTIRNFGVKEFNREEIPSPQPGDEVSLILDRGNSIIDITEPGGKGGFIGNEVTGTVLSFGGSDEMITLETEEGEVQGFILKAVVATKLNGIRMGTKVTLAIDGQDRVMDAYQAE